MVNQLGYIKSIRLFHILIKNNQLTTRCAAINAANVLRPGAPGAQKETWILLPLMVIPSAACWTSSACSAVLYSTTAKPPT